MPILEGQNHVLIKFYIKLQASVAMKQSKLIIDGKYIYNEVLYIRNKVL